MPKFKLNKLIRDGFVQEYEESNQVAVYRKISQEQHKKFLIEKIVEEAKELHSSYSSADIAKELGDMQQIINDLAKISGVKKTQIEVARKTRFNKLSGFTKGVYIETLELADDDEWVEYYRKFPRLFPEVIDK